MPNIPGRLTYKGFISPAPGELNKEKAKQLARVYGACRATSVARDQDLKEDKNNKRLCAAIAWKSLNK
jgi:hypothetical protein